MTDVISSELKKRKDAVVQYEAGGRPELAADETAEAEVLSRYMPEQMSEAEVIALIKEAIASTGATSVKDIGKVRWLK